MSGISALMQLTILVIITVIVLSNLFATALRLSPAHKPIVNRQASTQAYGKYSSIQVPNRFKVDTTKRSSSLSYDASSIISSAAAGPSIVASTLEQVLTQASNQPVTLKIWSTIFSSKLYMWVWFQLTYRMNFKYLYHAQQFIWRFLGLRMPLPWEDSILGFLSEHSALLARIMSVSYLASVACALLPRVGINVRSDFPAFLSKLMTIAFSVHLSDMFVTKFLSLFAPRFAENRRQSYVIKRTTSVLLWVLGVLVECELISTFLRIPLTSILAFGGVGKRHSRLDKQSN